MILTAEGCVEDDAHVVEVRVGVTAWATDDSNWLLGPGVRVWSTVLDIRRDFRARPEVDSDVVSRPFHSVDTTSSIVESSTETG